MKTPETNTQLPSGSPGSDRPDSAFCCDKPDILRLPDGLAYCRNCLKTLVHPWPVPTAFEDVSSSSNGQASPSSESPKESSVSQWAADVASVSPEPVKSLKTEDFETFWNSPSPAGKQKDCYLDETSSTTIESAPMTSESLLAAFRLIFGDEKAKPLPQQIREGLAPVAGSLGSQADALRNLWISIDTLTEKLDLQAGAICALADSNFQLIEEMQRIDSEPQEEEDNPSATMNSGKGRIIRKGSER